MTEILKGKTLLVVEDEADLREPLVAEFESYGCRVLEAKNGRQAYDIILSDKIDAVISDIRMPGGDGVELLHRIKALDHDVPVVMLITGFSDLSREDAYDLGAEAILTKPFDLDEIDSAVIRILTPREVRWQAPVDPARIKRKIEHSFTALSDATETGHLKIGRGGLFLHMPDAHPVRGDLVSLNIRFSSGDFLSIEGAGIIRWVRSEDEADLPRGCGVEFEALTDESRAKILAFTESLKIRSYIPKL
jgi:CheY-like chemotaxis protein